MKYAHWAHRIEWLLGLFTVSTAFVVWWVSRQPLEQGMTLYEFYPLLGLVAFGLMWTHFISGALQRYWKLGKTASRYQTVSMTIVLGCIIAHPALLWLALWRDDFGVPPISHYLAYGGTVLLNVALFVAMIALTLFVAYEMKRWLTNYKWWNYIERLQLLAMLMIFFHALVLGGEVSVGWYAVVWWLYGVTLVASALYAYYDDYVSNTMEGSGDGK